MAKVYLFRRIHKTDDSQKEVYEESIKTIVEHVLTGYTGTIFNYGKCGSSYDYEKADSKGANGDGIHDEIVLRVIHELFNQVYTMELTMEINIAIKYYNLFVEKQQNLTDFEEQNHGDEYELKKRNSKILKEHYVSMPKDVFSYITKRLKAATDESEVNTCEHSLFVISVRQTNLEKSKKLCGKLNLVHFATQENKTKEPGGDSNASGTETTISALLKIVSALASNSKTHIRYHNIRLMRILRDALGNNENVVIINYTSPCTDDSAEMSANVTQHMDEECTADVWKDLYQKEREKYKRLKTKLKAFDFWGSAEDKSILEECSSSVEIVKKSNVTTLEKISDEIAQLYDQLDKKNVELERNNQLCQQIEQRCHQQEERLNKVLCDQIILQDELSSIKHEVESTMEEITEVQHIMDQLKLNFDHNLTEITKKDKMLDKLNTLLIKTNEDMNTQKATFKDKLSEFSHVFTKLWREQADAMLKQEQQRETQLRDVFDALCKELRETHKDQLIKLSADAKLRESELRRLKEAQQDLLFGITLTASKESDC